MRLALLSDKPQMRHEPNSRRNDRARIAGVVPQFTHAQQLVTLFSHQVPCRCAHSSTIEYSSPPEAELLPGTDAQSKLSCVTRSHVIDACTG
jgi:hypothetical protein